MRMVHPGLTARTWGHCRPVAHREVATFLLGSLQYLQQHVRWCCALCAHGWGHVTLSAVALVVDRRGMSTEFPTSVWGFLDLVFVGLGFLTGSDVKDVEIEVVCASFAGGVFLETAEFFQHLDGLALSRGCHTSSARALHVLLRPGSPSCVHWRSVQVNTSQ